jgi:hypothetical protein
MNYFIEYPELNFYTYDNRAKAKKDEKQNHNIDIVLTINDRYYPIELKYSFYDGKEYMAGTKLNDVLHKKDINR